MQPGVQKTAMPVVAGILTLVTGGLRLMGVLFIIMIGIFFAAFEPAFEGMPRPEVFLTAAGIFLFITGVLAIAGGVYMLQRKSFGLSLTGAIAALLPFNLLGLASVVLLALSRKEFE